MFKNIFLLVFLCFFCVFSQQEFNVSIVLNNNDSVSFHKKSHIGDNKIMIYSDTTFLIDSRHKKIFYIKKNNIKHYLFLNNQSIVYVNFLENNNYTITGSNANFSNFINQYYRLYKPTIDSLLLRPYFSDQFEINLYNLLTEKIMNFYNNHEFFNTFDDDCHTYFNHLLKYEYLNSLASYLMNQKKDTSQIMPFYTDFDIKLLDRDLFESHISDTSHYDLDVFQNYIFNSIILFALDDYQYVTQKNNNFNNFNRYIFGFIGAKIPQKLWIGFFYNYIFKYAKFFDQNTIKYLENFLKNNAFDSNTIDQVLDYYYANPEEKIIFKQEDVFTSSVDFYMENQDGDYVSLGDFQGKVLYIDIWASWCGPCRKQFPHAEKLKKKFSKRELKKIKFIYISIDNDYVKWQESLEKLDLNGYHFISPANHNNGVGNYFQVSSIPRYIIINKEGVVIDQNAKRPSNENLFNELLQLIK